MKKFLQRVALWLSAERRQAIQMFFTSVIPLAVLLGLSTPEEGAQVVIIIMAVFQALTSLLSLAFLSTGDWGVGWAIARGAIYTLGATVAPALVVLNVWSAQHGDLIMTGVGLALTILSGFVAIFTSTTQNPLPGRHSVEDETV